MPGGRKSGRGGSRTGTPGKAYGNRTDLGGKIPAATAKGQAYGKAGEQAAAQAAVPMGTPEVPPPPPGGGPFTGRPEGMPAPGSLGGLFDPSQSPDEHVMNGAALGPGLGPQQLGIDPAAQMRKEDLESLAIWLPMLQEQVSRTGGSPQTRQFLRAVYGAGGGR